MKMTEYELIQCAMDNITDQEELNLAVALIREGSVTTREEIENWEDR